MVDPIIYIILAFLGATLAVKVTTTQNPVYSGLYLVLLFLLGSGISFLLGLEFMALLFLLVYAGAIAVLVLFVVMMLDVKAIESPWSANKKRLFFLLALVGLLSMSVIISQQNYLVQVKMLATATIGSLVSFNISSYNENIVNLFRPQLIDETIAHRLVSSMLEKELETKGISITLPLKTREEFFEDLDKTTTTWHNFCDSENLTNFFRTVIQQKRVEDSFDAGPAWFVNFDSPTALNDLSYLLYSTHAILLIIAGMVLLIAMVGAISLTLKKNCPESLYKQLGRQSLNAVFVVKEKSDTKLQFGTSNVATSSKT